MPRARLAFTSWCCSPCSPLLESGRAAAAALLLPVFASVTCASGCRFAGWSCCCCCWGVAARDTVGEASAPMDCAVRTAVWPSLPFTLLLVSLPCTNGEAMGAMPSLLCALLPSWERR